MRLEDIINDQFIKDKIQEVVNGALDSEQRQKSIRFEYPIDSGHEWKIISINTYDNELVIKLKKRK
jgi:hypothetical protein